MVNEAIRGYIYIPSDTYLLLNIVMLISLFINIIVFITVLFKVYKDIPLFIEDTDGE